MGTFEESMWADKDFSDNYLQRAEIYVLERRKVLGLISSFFEHYFQEGKVNLLDLGCGDGVITEELFRSDNIMNATLVDGSQSMLQKARERLEGRRNIHFIEASFQEVLNGAIEPGDVDFCVSSHAIHHLDMGTKERLFRFINLHLRAGGRFLNWDVVRSPSTEIEQWYFAVWKEWMQHKMNQFNITDETPEDVIRKFKDPVSMNNPDTLDAQLKALENAGFSDVDCYYKNGIFALFGGIKK